jgi:DNA-binding MarR family transcriptional regulator
MTRRMVIEYNYRMPRSTTSRATTARGRASGAATSRRPAKKQAAAPVAPAPALDASGLAAFTGYRVRRAEIFMRANFDRTLARKGLRPAEFSVLVLVADNPRVTQAALAAALSIARPNMVGLVDRLEQRGLLRREADDADRRSHGLVLTAKGASLATEARQLIARSEAALLGHLTAKERDDFLRLLGRVVAGNADA